MLDAFSNQDLPFEKLVEELNPERHLSHAPVAQVLFVLGGATTPLHLPGLSNHRLVQQRGTAKFDLSFFAAETADGLKLSLEYCTDLFEPETAERMLRHFQRILTEGWPIRAADPGAAASRRRGAGNDPRAGVRRSAVRSGGPLRA